MMLDPYSAAGRIALKAAMWVAIVATVAGSVTAANAYRKKAARAEAAAEKMAAQLIVLQANSEFAMEIAAANAVRTRKRESAVAGWMEGVRDEAKPVPANCRVAVADALAPVERALDGVRSLQNERRGGAPAADAQLRRRPRTPRRG